VPFLADEEIRQRYRALINLVDVAASGAVPDAHRARATGDLIRYICHVRHTIKRALHGLPLPETKEPPVLERTDDASLWVAPETDPEDAYFPAEPPAIPAVPSEPLPHLSEP
jgi:hypothetical protein